MSADGSWKVRVSTPIGKREVTFHFKTEGNALTGTMTAVTGDTAEIFEGSVDGQNLTCKSSMKKPFRLTMEYKAVIDGDNISGSAKAGMMGTSAFSGVRL